jgi:adenosylcobinamide-GDP ribazoletransferase
VDHAPEYLNKATGYFPLMGWLAGGLAAAVLYLGSLILPLGVAVFLAILATVWLTGAFHEDGLADICDGFGGGWTQQQILEIMKDSRVGTFGIIGLGIALGLKIVSLAGLPVELALHPCCRPHPQPRHGHRICRNSALCLGGRNVQVETCGEGKRARPLDVRGTDGAAAHGGHHLAVSGPGVVVAADTTDCRPGVSRSSVPEMDRRLHRRLPRRHPANP